MPECTKLTIDIFRRILSNAPNNSWIVARMSDGEILGVGTTSTEALHSAKTKYSHVERAQTVVLWKDAADK